MIKECLAKPRPTFSTPGRAKKKPDWCTRDDSYFKSEQRKDVATCSDGEKMGK